MTTRAVVRTVAFPAGSRPYMLRVSRDGREVWVQTAASNANVVLNADDLSVLASETVGRAPVTNAFTPDGRLSFVTHGNDTFASVLDTRTYKEIKRLEVGQNNQNIGFTRDGRTAFIAVTGANTVAVVDVARLEVIAQVPAGTQPFGLIVLNATQRQPAVPRALPRTGGATEAAPWSSLAIGLGAALLAGHAVLRRRRSS